MIVKRKLFSQEEEKNKSTKKKKGVAAGIIGSGIIAQTALGANLQKELLDEGDKESAKVVDKMVKKSGTKRVKMNTPM